MNLFTFQVYIHNGTQQHSLTLVTLKMKNIHKTINLKSFVIMILALRECYAKANSHQQDRTDY